MSYDKRACVGLSSCYASLGSNSSGLGEVAGKQKAIAGKLFKGKMKKSIIRKTALPQNTNTVIVTFILKFL